MNAAEQWKPHLFGDEEILLRREMSRARLYLEYGVGGSTLLAAQSGATTIVGIDTNKDWLRQTQAELSRIAPGISAQLIHCDLGPVGEWGMPTTRDRIADWPDYFQMPWRVFTERGDRPDLIYVDGRFRVACTLYSLLMLRKTRRLFGRAGRIVMHDFASRDYYRPVLKHANVVASQNTLVVLEPKRFGDPWRLTEDLLAHQFDPR
jgi:hypothetical protein